MTIRVTGLFWYPVKSCRGYAIEEAHIDRRGVRFDRSFMITDPHGVFLTQRELPRLALIVPELRDDQLAFSAPEVPPFALSVQCEGPTREVIVWQSVCRAVDQGDAVAAWLSAALDAPARLVRIADDHVRSVDPEYAPQPTDQLAFQDGYPFLVISEESLTDLNSRMAEPLPMNRFRPSIVVAGAEPYAEDTWRRFRIGDMLFTGVKPSARCAITQTDQFTAERGKEPLRTLFGYRRTAGNAILFGQNCVHDGPGVIRVGDEVTILTTQAGPAFATAK